MANVYTNLTVSLTRHQTTPVISMVQGDTGRGLNITITDDVYLNESETVTSELSAQLWAKKPSGKEVSMDASSVVRYSNSDSYRIVFDGSPTFGNILAETGRTRVQIVLSENGQRVTTFEIIIVVYPSVIDDSTFSSSTEYRNAINLLNELNNQKEILNTLITQFQNQLKLTVSVRYGSGTPVTQSTDKEGDLYIRIG